MPSPSLLASEKGFLGPTSQAQLAAGNLRMGLQEGRVRKFKVCRRCSALMLRLRERAMEESQRDRVFLSRVLLV